MMTRARYWTAVAESRMISALDFPSLSLEGVRYCSTRSFRSNSDRGFATTKIESACVRTMGGTEPDPVTTCERMTTDMLM